VDIDAWEAAGLYDPGAPHADERRALLAYLTERGATVEQMVEAHRFGGLPGVAGDLAVEQEMSTISVAELAATSDVSVERVERVLLAAGLPVDATTQVPADLSAALAGFEQGASLMGDDAVLAFTRVLGSAAANIAEAAVALFYAELGPGTPREGSDELARAHVSEIAMLAFTAVPEVLSRVLLAQFDRVRHRALLTRGWSAQDDGSEPTGPSAAEPSETVTIGFVDLVGSTAWAERLSLRDHSLALSRFESAAWSSAVLSGGRVVKTIGDEVFFAAPSPDAACRIAVEVARAAGEDDVLPAARAAVGHGVVTPREGDYFGPLVNVVSRLVKTADPGGLVVTAEVARELTRDRWVVDELAPQTLRGVQHEVEAFAVRPSG
jgi:adenylate cyclase